MGTVFRAEHVGIGRKLAVKILSPQMHDQEKFRLRFDREAALAGRMHHRNVVSAIDIGSTPEGLRYLVMEYAEGRTLADLLEGGPMTESRVMSLARQLCDGLHHAHEHGLVHRDLKPDNVIVERHSDDEETARILDFGIAIATADTSAKERKRLTTDGIVLGTPHYMAPEHASGQALDHRADLFSLGIICYEMLTGVRPFDGSGAEVVRAYQLRPIPSMKQRAPHVDVDPLLEAFTRALLARSRDARLPSARAARALLDRIARDRAVAAQQLGIELHDRGRMGSACSAPAPARFAYGTQRSPATGYLPAEEVPSDREAPATTGARAVEAITVRVRTPGRASAFASVEEDDAPAGALAKAGTGLDLDDVPAVGPVDPTAPSSCADLAMWGSMPGLEHGARPELRDLGLDLGLGGSPSAPAPLASSRPEAATCAMSPLRARPRRRAARRAAMLVAAGLCVAGLFVISALAPGRGRAPASLVVGTPMPEIPLLAPLPAPAPPPPPRATAPVTEAAPAPAPAPPPPPSTEHAGAKPTADRRSAAPAAPAAASPAPARPAPTQASDTPAAPAPDALALAEAPQTAPSTASVAELYGEIGRALKRLDDTHGQEATYDLWPRFRRIQILEALHTPEGCTQANGELRYLKRELVRRSR
jgi:serine/threonine-protein kinase